MSRAAACVVIVAVVSLSGLQWLCEGACADHAEPTPTCHAQPGADAAKLRAAPHDCADHGLTSAVTPSGSRSKMSPVALAFVPSQTTTVRVLALAPVPGARDESPPLVSRRVPLRI